VIRNSFTHDILVLLACAGVVGCSSDSAAAKAGETRRSPAATKPIPGAIDLGSRPYRPTALVAFGSVHGTIKASSEPPADSTAAGTRLCGGKPITVSIPQKGVAPSIVWIEDIATGKPFPIEKRGDLSIDDCVLDPAVQAAVVGTTFNVFNDDKEVHRLVFTRAGTHDTLTVMPFFNSGQVVASERLAKVPGVVDVQCVRHPWMHGYIAVFNHPYFAVTDEKGGFTIDSLPPGKYTVLAWHQGMTNPSSQAVQIAANSTATLDLTLP
jgi:plastocyanin